MAGALKRGSPDLSEELVLMRALRDMNLPKFVFDDVPLFLGLINDLFPELVCPRVRYPQLNDVLEEDFAEHHYQVIPCARHDYTLKGTRVRSRTVRVYYERNTATRRAS